jgi:lambda family phage portal protein
LGWGPTAGDANTVTFESLDLVRRRSRGMVRNNAWAKNALASFVGSCIGTGIRPLSLHPNPKVRKQIHRLWNDWTEEADAAERTDFYGLQALVCREIMEAGEVLARFRPRLASDGMSVPLQIQGLEADHLPLNYVMLAPNGNEIRFGIELNGIGKRAAYWVHKTHPGDATNPKPDPTYVRVPAKYMLHCFKPERFGQLRGMPWFATVLIKLYELDQYDDADLVRKKVAAMFAMFIERATPDEGTLPSDLVPPSDAPMNPQVVSGTIEPGSVNYLDRDEKAVSSTPPDSGAGYVPFYTTHLRSIAAGLDLTYEMLSGDLSKVNYSSIRAGLVEFRRRLEQFQYTVMIHQFCRPTFKEWMNTALLAGALPGCDPGDKDLYRVAWMPQGFDWVDPLKDAKARIMEVRAGFTPRRDVVASLGYDVEEVDEAQAADNKRSDALGLHYDSDGRILPVAGEGEAAGSTQPQPDPTKGKPATPPRQRSGDGGDSASEAFEMALMLCAMVQETEGIDTRKVRAVLTALDMSPGSAAIRKQFLKMLYEPEPETKD